MLLFLNALSASNAGLHARNSKTVCLSQRTSTRPEEAHAVMILNTVGMTLAPQLLSLNVVSQAISTSSFLQFAVISHHRLKFLWSENHVNNRRGLCGSRQIDCCQRSCRVS